MSRIPIEYPFLKTKSIQYAVISGPSFAAEVAAGLPTNLAVASKSVALAHELANRWSSNALHLFPTDDLIGVQVGGALKNLYAIAIGMADGAGFGSNARAALITRAFAEITQIAVALGGRAETVAGLSGLGDLLLTATDSQSRNQRFGYLLGQGKSIEEAERLIGEVIEGKEIAPQIDQLLAHLKLVLPFGQKIHQTILQNRSPKALIEEVLKQ